ncbi:hypothetical protein ACWKWP_17345 [Agromyces soli]
MSEDQERADEHPGAHAVEVRLIVDVANVMGSRPDGWWRDRAGAAERLLATLEPLVGRVVDLEQAGRVRLVELVAVTEGRARDASAPGPGIRVVAAPADGDSTIVELAGEAARELEGAAPEAAREQLGDATGTRRGPGDAVEASGALALRPLVVTADRGLRERLPAAALVAGPGWLNELAGR